MALDENDDDWIDVDDNESPNLASYSTKTYSKQNETVSILKKVQNLAQENLKNSIEEIITSVQESMQG